MQNLSHYKHCLYSLSRKRGAVRSRSAAHLRMSENACCACRLGANGQNWILVFVAIIFVLLKYVFKVI